MKRSHRCLILSETKPPSSSLLYKLNGGFDDIFYRAWKRRVGESKLRVIVEEDTIVVKEMETRYHSRAAASFSAAVLNALLEQCLPGTTLDDLPLESDGTGREHILNLFLHVIRGKSR